MSKTGTAAMEGRVTAIRVVKSNVSVSVVLAGEVLRRFPIGKVSRTAARKNAQVFAEGVRVGMILGAA